MLRSLATFVFLLSCAGCIHAQTSIANGATISGGASLQPGGACQITTTTLPSGQVGVFYDTFVQTSNCQAPLTFSVSAGTFPGWATLNPSTGEISGTPTGAAANSFTIKVVDSGGHQDFLTAGLSIITTSGGTPALPDSALLNWNTARSATPTSNVTVCVGTPANAALLPGGSCSASFAGTSAGLTAALAAAACGQVINIAPGNFGSGAVTPYAGAFNWPKLQCPNTNWLWIARDLSDTSWPAEGNRIDPCYAGIAQSVIPFEPYPAWDTNANGPCVRHMPLFLCNQTSGNSCWGWDPTFDSPAGNHIRFIGIEFARDDSFDLALTLWDFDYAPSPSCDLSGSGNTALPLHADLCQADQPNFIIFDQCLFHGSPQRQTATGLKMAGVTWVAVLDSFAWDVGVTFAGGGGDSHFYGGGTGHGYTGVGHWLYKNTFSESSTMANEVCGAFGEPTSPVTGADGIPTDVAWQQDWFWKKPLWDPQIGQAYNQAQTIEGVSYGPTPAQELDVNPAAVSVQLGSEYQINNVVLWDTNAGINKIGVGNNNPPQVDGVVNGNSTTGLLIKNGEHNVGVNPWVSQNQVTYKYVACSGAGVPDASCASATTTGAHTVTFFAPLLDNHLATQGNNLTLSASATVTVTSAAPAKQIDITPNSPTLEIQPSYSDIYFNVRKFCVTMFAFPNYSPSTITWKVDGTINGNATIGTITGITGSSFSGTSPSEVAYCSGTQTGNHSITAAGDDGTVSAASVINVTASAVIYNFDLRAFVSKNAWELKCGARMLVEKTIAEFCYAGAGNGGGQPGNWFLTQTGNQTNQTTDGTGVDVGYGPQHINDITIRYFHGIHLGGGMVLAALNAALGLHRVDVNHSICDDCDYTKWGNGFQKRSQVLQVSGTASSTKVLPWTSASNPLAGDLSVTHISFFGPVTSQISIANNNAQFQLGPFTWKNNIVSSTGSTTFVDNNGDKNDCNTATGSGATNTEAAAFQGTGYAPPKPCFKTYSFSPNVFMDSTADPSVFVSPNIFLTPATAVGFVNYSGGNGGDYRLCTGFHTPSILCTVASPYAAGQADQADDGTDQGGDPANQAIYDLAVRQGTRTP